MTHKDVFYLNSFVISGTVDTPSLRDRAAALGDAEKVSIYCFYSNLNSVKETESLGVIFTMCAHFYIWLLMILQ